MKEKTLQLKNYTTDYINEIWKKYRKGDHVTDQELGLMYCQIMTALPYLESRGTEYNIVKTDTYIRKNEITEYLLARGYGTVVEVDGMEHEL